jgi:hypothetical protein
MLNVRPTEEGAWQSQVFQIPVANIIITLLDVLADEGAKESDTKRRFIIALGAVVGHGRDGSFDSDIRVSDSLE